MPPWDSGDRRYREYEWLHEQVVERGRSAGDIADECDVSRATVQRYIKEHGLSGYGYTNRVRRRLGLVDGDGDDREAEADGETGDGGQ